MTPSVSQIRVQDIDHCGIVAVIIDQMCLVEQINQMLGTHPQEIVSPCLAVKAMILNGLGLVSAPLYLFEKFFVGRCAFRPDVPSGRKAQRQRSICWGRGYVQNI